MATTGKPMETEWAVTNDEAAGEYVRALVDYIAGAEYELLVMVGALRSGGWSWAKVGDAVGMTRQGAQQAYGRKDKGHEDPRCVELYVQLCRQAEEQGDESEAAAELRRLYRHLSIRTARIIYVVRAKCPDCKGQLEVEGCETCSGWTDAEPDGRGRRIVSRHYVPERAAQVAARIAGAFVQETTRRAPKGTRLACRDCREIPCICHELDERAPIIPRRLVEEAPDDEESF